jgi:hypothetical protein
MNQRILKKSLKKLSYLKKQHDSPSQQNRSEGSFTDLPQIESIVQINVNSAVAIDLKEKIESIKIFDVNYSDIEQIYFRDQSIEVFSIPFNTANEDLVVSISNDMISFVIAKEELLVNGNKRFIIKNHKNEILYQLEQNADDKLGNFVFNDYEHGFFKLTTTIYNPVIVTEASCLYQTKFSACMQCFWKECTSDWVCGTALALQPVKVLAFAAGMCGLNTVLSIQ